MKRFAMIAIAMILLLQGVPELFVSAAALPGTTYNVPSSNRQDQLINDKWKFIKQDVASAQTVGFNDTTWASIDLPHTWNNIDGQTSGKYYRGVGWYRRDLTVDASLQGQKIFIQFDGANTTTDLYVNGTHVGEQHVGGYAIFRYDITNLIKFGQNNVLAVKVNNAFNKDIPPYDADYTSFGGIYRDVHMIVVDPVHVDLMDFGSSGVYLKQSNVSASKADLEVKATIVNDSPQNKSVTVNATVVDNSNQVVATLSQSSTINSGQKWVFTKSTSISQPHLWNGLDDPYMYNVFVEVIENDLTRDMVSQPLGIRFFSVDANNGFFLNGEYLDLHGVNRHQDRQDKGWAISKADHLEDFNLIKDMGATSIRLAHYEHAQYFYDLCDLNGMVVWAEIPIVDNIIDSTAFENNAKQYLIELIRQNYNHPSIMFWSVANEVTLHATDNNNVPFPDPTTLIQKLNTLAKLEDPTRLTTLASASDDHSSNFITDTMGANKYYGWYYGKMTDLGTWADNYHKKYPITKMGVTEYGAGASINYHSESPKSGDHTEEYQSLYHEESWMAMKTRPYIWSKYVWNMFDFAVAARNEGDTPGRNDKGLVTYDRKTKKDSYYWYQANWSKIPVVHITGKRMTNVKNPKEIKVYSNMDSVELIVNGVLLGSKTNSDHLYIWPNVELINGLNTVVAIGTKDGAVVMQDNALWNCYEERLTVDGEWSWVREELNSAVLDSNNPNYIKLPTLEGSLDGTGSSTNNVSNILLRDPKSSDFTLTTKLKFDANQNFQWAGLVVYTDDDNFVSLGRMASGVPAKRYIRFSKEIGGVTNNGTGIEETLSASIIYLKIEKKVNTYNGYYSYDGSTWTSAGSWSAVSLNNPKVGVFARKRSGNVTNAEFYDFKLNDTLIHFANIPITSNEYQINDGSGTISGIIAKTPITEFKSKFSLRSDLEIKVYYRDGLTEVTNGYIEKGMIVNVSKMQGGFITKSYVIAVIPGGLLKSSEYIVDDDEEKITEVPVETTVAEFMNQLTLLQSATMQIFDNDRNEVTTGYLEKGMYVIVTTSDETMKKSYQIVVNSSTKLVTGIILTGEGDQTAITTKGGTLQILAAIVPEDAEDMTVTWSVVNVDGTTTDKAEISAMGLLKVRLNGTVKVIATAHDGSGVKGELTITISGQDDDVDLGQEPDYDPVQVTKIDVTAVSNATSITSKGGTLQMSNVVTPADADNKTITWYVYNTDMTVTDKATININSGLLTALKNGTVIVVALAGDDSGVKGELTITISGQDEIVCTTCGGGGDGGSTPPPSPPQIGLSDGQQLFTQAELQNIQDGKVLLVLNKGNTEAVLPMTDLLSTLKRPVEVQAGGVSITISMANLQALVGQLPENNQDSRLIVRIATALNSGEGVSGSNFKVDGPVHNLDILLVDTTGKETKLNSFPVPIQVSLPYIGEHVDEGLLGAYVFDEVAREWKYIGGKVDTINKLITVNAPHFSKYAVLELNKTFTDVPTNHWAYRTIKVLSAKHIISGESATYFNPNGQTTRAEFVSLLVRALGLSTDNYRLSFTDVRTSDWYAGDVAAAYGAGLITGVSADKFAPGDRITREQMATLIVRAYEFVHGSQPISGDKLVEMIDHQLVSAWSIMKVNKAINLDLMKGQSAIVFAPLSYTTRAETAQAIYNLIQRFE